jgi:hypothetical protein
MAMMVRTAGTEQGAAMIAASAIALVIDLLDGWGLDR